MDYTVISFILVCGNFRGLTETDIRSSDS